MNMEDKIFNVFSGWFNVDLVDITSPQEVEDAAGSCAADLVRNIPNIDGVINRLTEMLNNWTPDLVLRFMNVTLVDWLFDEPSEQTLKHVLQLVIADLKYYKGNAEAYQPGANIA